MKIFIIGFPSSGRTTVAQALVSDNCKYVDASGWLKISFRQRRHDENIHKYHDEYHSYVSVRLKAKPSLVVDHVNTYLIDFNVNYIIDNIFSPKDFINLFDYNHDVVVFLNRTDNANELRDYENIGVVVMRDYCFWLSSAGLLPKSQWIEYNFKIPGEESDFIKQLGAKNSVFLVKSISKVIQSLRDSIIQTLDMEISE